MINQRNLGPILAAAGAALAAAAIIAGFIITGGPGDARDQRLDGLTVDDLHKVFNVVQCAYNGSGVAPATIDAAMKAQGRIAKDEPLQSCDLGIEPHDIAVSSGRTPSNPGDLSYEATGKDTVTFCANFRRPGDGQHYTEYGPRRPTSIFRDPHPAGVHCYDITLTESEIRYDMVFD